MPRDQARISNRLIGECGLNSCVCIHHDADHLPTGMVIECNVEGCS